jgi:hypothetical protein
MIIVFITVMVLYSIRKLPFLFVGWFWYLGTLIPVIGLVPFGTQAMADRYTYLPSVGIAIILAWCFPLLLPRNINTQTTIIPAGNRHDDTVVCFNLAAMRLTGTTA